ncbi:hypothetical protein ZIOFF_053808 [Zingiber officinale]|uniref:EIPR1-like beta-propeller domain-containing protein n=1 Tax=Zingiber officinale TaxID=94328 RepID=A0A8J5FCU5_ZINOF|nr:hypothetical protein ZIOFF_053808 [Zingiber officinale]
MRGPSTGIVYGGLKYQARCITDVKADVDHTSFLAGTLSLKEENEVHLIRLSPSGSELICDGLFYHPNEIWDLKSCPFDPRIFSTVFTSVLCHIGNTCAAEISGFTIVLSWRDHFAHLLKPEGHSMRATSSHGKRTCLWLVRLTATTTSVISQESVGMLQNLSGGAWDPHDRNALSGICDSSLQFWDLRTMKKTTSIEQAHIRDVDYNSKKQHFLVSLITVIILCCFSKLWNMSTLQVTAEDVSGIQLWDLRRPKFPVKELPGHAHWTWAVRHNPEYEDLILSAGTDSTINLWSIRLPGNEGSSSESLFDSPTTLKDSLINSYTDYEDSVYGLAWSTREPLIFASLSYDGRCEASLSVARISVLTFSFCILSLVIVESVKSFIKRK